MISRRSSTHIRAPTSRSRYGRVWDEVEQPGFDATVAAGNEIIELSPEAQAEFDVKAEAVEARWIEEATAQGLDGAALVAAAKEAVAKYSN